MAVPTRIVTDSLADVSVPAAAVWSRRVAVVLGQNPGLFTGPGTNTYLIGTGPRPLLLDTGQGTDAYLAGLERACRETRPTAGLQAILLTHGHGDHSGGVAGVRRRFAPVEVFKMPWPGEDPEGMLFHPLADGEQIRTEGATLHAIWTPGHARDHMCFYLEEERALFTGDMVLGAGTSVIPENGDLAAYLASLRRLRELDATVIYPAHGPAIHDPRAKITQYLEHRQLREQQILACLERGIGAPRQIVQRLYTDVPQDLHLAAAMSVTAHLRKLEAEGRVSRNGETWALD